MNDDLVTPAPEPIIDLAALDAAIDTVATDVDQLDATWEDLAVLLAALTDARANLDTALRAVSTTLAAKLPDKEVVLEGVGTIVASATSKRTTDWDAILTRLRARATVDTDTGEVITDPGEAADRAFELLGAVAPLTKSTAARQAALKKLDIPTDEVQEDEWRTPTASIRHRPS